MYSLLFNRQIMTWIFVTLIAACMVVASALAADQPNQADYAGEKTVVLQVKPIFFSLKTNKPDYARFRFADLEGEFHVKTSLPAYDCLVVATQKREQRQVRFTRKTHRIVHCDK